MATVTHSITTVARSKWTFSRHHGKSSGRTQTGSCTRSSSAGNSGTKAQRARTLHLVGGRIICRKVSCDAIGIYYATTTGNTEAAAEWVKDLMPGDTTDIQEIGEASISDLEAHDGLIVGAPTWHTGAKTERSGTDWDAVLDDLKGLNLKDKPVAVFGLGDSAGYGDNFVDAIEEIHDVFAATGARMIGYVSPDGYDFTESKAVRDGQFLGLPLDANNEDDLTEERVKTWTKQLVEEGMKA